MMMKSIQRTALNVGALNVGDRVRLVRGTMRGHTATIAAANSGVYFLIGDWTQQTGFVLVNYGPIELDDLKKL